MTRHAQLLLLLRGWMLAHESKLSQPGWAAAERAEATYHLPSSGGCHNARQAQPQLVLLVGAGMDAGTGALSAKTHGGRRLPVPRAQHTHRAERVVMMSAKPSCSCYCCE
jgi:hypothetical protein